ACESASTSGSTLAPVAYNLLHPPRTGASLIGSAKDGQACSAFVTPPRAGGFRASTIASTEEHPCRALSLRPTIKPFAAGSKRGMVIPPSSDRRRATPAAERAY